MFFGVIYQNVEFNNLNQILRDDTLFDFGIVVLLAFVIIASFRDVEAIFVFFNSQMKNCTINLFFQVCSVE